MPRSPPVDVTPRSLEARIAAWVPSRRSVELGPHEGATIALHTYWFAGWKARGRSAAGVVPLEARAEEGTGRLVVDVPGGVEAVDVRFESTPLRSWAACASGAALIVWILGGLRLALRWKRTPRGSAPRRARRARDPAAAGTGAEAHEGSTGAALERQA
jgi:hypothetical protein